MELTKKNVLVVGFEKTGEALCRFLAKRGAQVLVTEKKTGKALGGKIARWKGRGIRFETGGHRLNSFLKADLIIPSPGVPPIPEISAAKREGIPVISEIELAFHFLKGSIVGITGSNGKSTTATLAYRILKEGGLKAYLAGNIGTPLISFADKSREDHIYVTEISSFQLAYTRRFKPAVSVFLNISENHIDWHKTFKRYYEAKKKLVLRLKEQDTAILNRDDPLVWNLAGDVRGNVCGFSRTRKVRRGCFVENGWIVFRSGSSEKIIRTSSIPLPGRHNWENVMAAALLGRLTGIPAAGIRTSIAAFKGLEHRLEEVRTFNGIRFINDSKATSVAATLKALASIDRKAVLILGGRDKGGDFGPLRRAVRSKAAGVILIGEAKDKIEAALGGGIPTVRVSSYREAVRKAYETASPGQIVLLAPACTSWDMFKNFEERGRVFKREVHKLAEAAEKRRA